MTGTQQKASPVPPPTHCAPVKGLAFVPSPSSWLLSERPLKQYTWGTEVKQDPETCLYGTSAPAGSPKLRGSERAHSKFPAGPGLLSTQAALRSAHGRVE